MGFEGSFRAIEAAVDLWACTLVCGLVAVTIFSSLCEENICALGGITLAF